LIVPQLGRHLWDWYFDLSDRVRRVRDGVCEPIPPTEFVAWCQATDNIVYPNEYAMLSAMDSAFCAEMNKELNDYNERQKALQAAEAEKSSRGRRRRY